MYELFVTLRKPKTEPTIITETEYYKVKLCNLPFEPNYTLVKEIINHYCNSIKYNFKDIVVKAEIIYKYSKTIHY